jgi:hypothetical protein
MADFFLAAEMIGVTSARILLARQGVASDHAAIAPSGLFLTDGLHASEKSIHKITELWSGLFRQVRTICRWPDHWFVAKPREMSAIADRARAQTFAN